MPRTRNPYPSALQDHVVALHRVGRSIKELAKQFEPSAISLYELCFVASLPWDELPAKVFG
ncbi:MAG: hypothetical protein AAFV49_03795 [Pseudomonadota bacterium]